MPIQSDTATARCIIFTATGSPQAPSTSRALPSRVRSERPMNLLFRRYTRSGYAPPWFYAIAVVAFAGLAVWALVQMDWIVAALGLAMVPVTIAGARVMRRLTVA